MTKIPGTPPGGPDAAQVTPGAIRVIGFLAAGGSLVVLADFAPQAAVGLALVLGLGVLLLHANELANLSNLFQTATGHPPAS